MIARDLVSSFTKSAVADTSSMRNALPLETAEKTISEAMLSLSTARTYSWMAESSSMLLSLSRYWLGSVAHFKKKN